jgi:hypothetical protein
LELIIGNEPEKIAFQPGTKGRKPQHNRGNNLSHASKSIVYLSGRINETIILFLTSEREARIGMHTSLVCGSERTCSGRVLKQLKSKPAVEAAS